jgi:predicted ABC-type sugar transport system permease subunit
VNPEAAQQIRLSPTEGADMKLPLTSSAQLSVRPFLQHWQEYGILAVFLLEFVFFSLVSNHFLTPENLINVALQTSIIAIIAAGMTFVILPAVLPNQLKKRDTECVKA